MTNTEENLKKSISGETQANKRYLAFAKKAEEEGHTEIAELFRKLAGIELNEHAQEEYELLDEKIGTTEENLQTAIDGETYEFTKMYPEFVKTAEKEENTAAAERFKEVAEDEKEHSEKFKEALKKLKGKKNE